MGQFGLLADELKVKVLPPQEAMGQKLFDDGGVGLITIYEGQIRADVDDKRQQYKVKLTWNRSGYEATCSCKTAPARVCEHVWATVLAARVNGYFDEHEAGWDDGYGDDDDSARAKYGYRVVFGGGSRAGRSGPGKKSRWKAALAALAGEANGAVAGAGSAWPASRQVVYLIDVEQTLAGQALVVEVCTREPRKDGELSKPRAAKLGRAAVAALPDGEDRLIVAMLNGGERQDYGYYYDRETSTFRLGSTLARVALPRMCGTGRCLLRPRGWGTQPYVTLSWGDDRPWEMHVEVRRDQGKRAFTVQGVLERGDERRALAQPTMLTAGGLVFWPDGVVEPLEDFGGFGWVAYLREHGVIRVPEGESGELSRRLYEAGHVPGLRLPDDLKLEEVRVPLTPHVKLRAPRQKYYYNDNRLNATLTFAYEDATVEGTSHGGASIVQAERGRVIVRDQQKEAEARARLYQLGFRDAYSYDAGRKSLQLTPSKLPKVVATLVREGWHVEAEGKLYRQPGEFRLEVSSGIDWFDLHAQVQFGEQTATLPQLLAALRRGEGVVQLGDGTFGMLPDEWLKKYGSLAGMGKEEGGALRFGRAQVGLLDALLAAQGDGAAKWDQTFEQTRRMLREFEGVKALDAPPGFVGALRPYQREGLGWLEFLRKFGFGGCLADDMGLGKTVQVLAMLAGRTREANRSKSRRSPSLIVVPRSLVFNWMAEAARFAPGLRVLDHSHAGRARSGEHLADYDVVLTTYGTLRRDAAYLKDVEFDYLILDEAQAVKNAASESAKATRLLRGRHPLALSGTPVQNHLGELWSLFEFLNPGMLGSASVFSSLAGASRSIDEGSRQVLARAVRPFVLRRTKEQVAKDLPEKLEQTIYCELEGEQRKLYDELKEYYRKSLLERVARDGMNKAKFQVLEALLRLRQAACHPGLLDKARGDDASAKLDMLLPRLGEVVEEGHKALVFSQFTTFLAIVRKKLTNQKIKFEYLDGKTRDRQARVEKFQADGKCKVFLISLKAGGVGLNLTAADYVFLLDPWWNPAAEAQAIDRTHRIGQTKQVFACRLIAKDTVEEKVLELQRSKRELADAIINADNSLISGLRREDLELLLS